MPMKALSLLLVLFSSGTQARAADWKGWVAEAGLKASVSGRCSSYLRVNPDQASRLSSLCSTLTAEMVRALDSTRDSQTRGLLFATEVTRSVLQDSRTPAFLSRFRGFLEALDRDPVRGQRIPLFQDLIETYGSNESASLAMVTLFQDNSFKPDLPSPPLHWILLNSYSNEWKIAPGPLSDLKTILGRIRTNDPASLLARVDAYPRRLETQRKFFNDKFYYFYLPRYLTTRLMARAVELEQKNPGDRILIRRVMRALPTLLSLVYKNAHERNSYIKSLLLPIKPSATYADDGSLRVQPGWEYRYRDLYMAYHGTLDALGERDRIGFDRFRKMIGTRPGEAIDLISK